MEEWKQIEGFGGRYWVSSLGRIWTEKKHCFIHPRYRGEQRYGFVTLKYHNDKKSFTIHRLVATYFIPNPLNLPCVNHKNANRYDNTVGNLEWCDYKYNTHHAMYTTHNFQQAIPFKPVRCVETGIIYPSIAEAARMTNGCKGSIARAVRIPHYTSGGYHWEELK